MQHSFSKICMHCCTVGCGEASGHADGYEVLLQIVRRPLEDFEERKFEEIYSNLRRQRQALEQQWLRKERVRAETRAAAKVPVRC